MTEPRQIGIAGDYLGLIRLFRVRLLDLDINYATLDEIAGWAERYASKLLGEEPAKSLGQMSFDAIMGAMGVRLVMIEDKAATVRIRQRLDFAHRKYPMRPAGRHEPIALRVTHEKLRQIAVSGGLARAQKMTPRQRTISAQKAARARWRKSKLTARDFHYVSRG